MLPDSDEALAATADIHATYERDGFGPAMGKFLALTTLKGPIPADFPSHHGGFIGGESDWKGEPEAFAATLREVLAEGR